MNTLPDILNLVGNIHPISLYWSPHKTITPKIWVVCVDLPHRAVLTHVHQGYEALIHIGYVGALLAYLSYYEPCSTGCGEAK